MKSLLSLVLLLTSLLSSHAYDGSVRGGVSRVEVERELWGFDWTNLMCTLQRQSMTRLTRLDTHPARLQSTLECAKPAKSVPLNARESPARWVATVPTAPFRTPSTCRIADGITTQTARNTEDPAMEDRLTTKTRTEATRLVTCPPACRKEVGFSTHSSTSSVVRPWR